MKIVGKVNFNIVVLSALLFTAIAVFVAVNTSSMMVNEAKRTVNSVVKATVGRIDQLMTGVETAVANQKWIIGEHLSDPDYMYRITAELVENNEYIVGSTVAFAPNHFPSKGFYWAPYTCDDGAGALKSFQLGNDDNRYHEQSWYVDAVKAKRSIWSEPYFDDGGAKIWMSTYSMPIYDAQSNLCAVFTADLSLEQLKGHVARICPYPQSYAVLRSAQGAVLVEPPKDRQLNDGDGNTITIRDKADNGWTVEIVCPIEEILKAAQQLVVRIVVFSVAGLGLIFLLSWFYSSRLQRATAERQRIESELDTARSIQSGILPKSFPPNVSACIRPAREVGGDLYDFFEQDGKLFFIVGDASGKGVPAALFSFMAVTVFRLSCRLGLAPHEIVSQINATLTNGNDMCMFVTAFVGMLDCATGRFEYCNAGHNPPVLAVDGTVEFLDVKRNIPTGVMDGFVYASQTATLKRGTRLFVYTDGVTEAERADRAQYGEGRLKDFVAANAATPVSELSESLISDVDRYVSGAEQSDDITVMVIGA